MNQGRLIEQLEKDEGFVSHAYQDSEGLWTIGFGRLIDQSIPSAGITKDEARMLLRNNASDVVGDLAHGGDSFQRRVKRLLQTWRLTLAGHGCPGSKT